MRMPFGRHRGKDVSQLPTHYIIWLLQTCDLRQPLLQELKDEADRREDEADRYSSNTHALPVPVRNMCERLLTSGYRAMAQKMHPDHGGTHAAMILLTQAVEHLRRVIH